MAATPPAMPLPLAPQSGGTATSKLPVWVRAVLWLDFACCLASMAFAGLALAALQAPDNPAHILQRLPWDAGTLAAIAVFGGLANSFLLRQKLAGLWLAALAVLAVLAAQAVALWSIVYRSLNPELLDCPVGVFVAGAALGLIIRLAYNGLWLAAVWRVHRHRQAHLPRA